MRTVFALLLSLVATIASAEHYGAPITLKSAQALEVAIKQLGTTKTADVLIEARVDKVCQMKGCWLGLKSASSEIHVTFANESFFVPPSLQGKTVLAQGKLTAEPMTLDEARQQAKDAGRDPAAVKQPGVRYTLVASGIAVRT